MNRQTYDGTEKVELELQGTDDRPNEPAAEMNRQTYDNAEKVEPERQNADNRPNEPAAEMNSQTYDDAKKVEPERQSTDNRPNEPVVELFSVDDKTNLRDRWEKIQTGFVDEPKQAVAKADELVNDIVQRLTESFKRERSNLEKQWERGDQVSTEELRVTMQRYRSLHNRLLDAS